MDDDIKKLERVFQVMAEEVATKKLVAVPFFPRACKEAAEMFADDMSLMIACGKEKRYANPQVCPIIKAE
jgi:hypothetical protein